MQFQSHYNRFLLSLEGTKNIYVSFCENIISFCAPRTFRFADYTGIVKVLIPELFQNTSLPIVFNPSFIVMTAKTESL